MRNVYIRAPRTEQSLAIAKLLASSRAGLQVVGVWDDGRKRPRRSRWFADHIIEADVPQGASIVLTTARHTEDALKGGPIRLGQITMTQKALFAYDKMKFLGWAESIGVHVPRTVPGSSRELPSLPVFYKGAHEQGGGRRGVARSYGELPEDRRGLIIQQYIPTVGTYGVGFLAADGEIIASVSHYERSSYPTSGGSAITIMRHEDAGLHELTSHLIRSMGFSGWGLAEFKKDVDGRYVLMEINAKMWASVEFTFRNCPAMFEALFGVRPNLRPVAKLTYVNRALAAAGGGALHAVTELFGTERLRYPGTLRHVASGMRRQFRRDGA